MEKGWLEAGDVLAGRYVITSVEHITGLGALYCANDGDGQISRTLAIKEVILIPSEQQPLDDIIDAFHQKSELLTTLDHPTIPRLLDYFVEGENAYSVTEFIDGYDLEHAMNHNTITFTLDDIIAWGITLGETLAYLHNRAPHPIVYRDLKPANIMLYENDVYLVDFDIAGVFPKELTLDPLGTDGYAAPEQYRGVVTPQIDIYALGATLHHLISGKDPRLERPFSFAQRSLRTKYEDVSDALELVIMRALEYEPEDRYLTAAEMTEALRRAHR